MELLGTTRDELIAYAGKLGFPGYRGKQIADWLYKKSIHSISDMINLPVNLRSQLEETSTLTRSKVINKSTSEDGTTKFLLELGDGETIESVLLPYSDRVSACVSTQVGCAAGCLFCATAQCGFVRNLTAGEIVDQILTLQDNSGLRITHVVFMGMGEPLMNMSNVLDSIYILNNEIGISMRRLTISTVGIIPAIKKLARLDLQLTLAISLHAPNDELRRKIIPVATRFPLDELMDTCRNYADKTKRRITFEYLLLAGVNDSPVQAEQLAGLVKGILGHVNLIPYNEVIGKEFKRPSHAAISAFRSVLEKNSIEVTQRMERGHSVSAACGQLRRRHINK